MSNLNINGIIKATGGGASLLDTELIIEKNSGTNGYIKYKSGLIIQWGYQSLSSAGTQTITFTTPFTSLAYGFCHAQYKRSKNDYDKTVIIARTTTNVTIYSSSYAMDYLWMAVGY